MSFISFAYPSVAMSDDSIGLALVDKVLVRTKDTNNRIHTQSDIATGFAEIMLIDAKLLQSNAEQYPRWRSRDC